ncbi:MAG: ferritin-like fold-containing protein, partial [Micromonosporaceae bacterium]
MSANDSDRPGRDAPAGGAGPASGVAAQEDPVYRPAVIDLVGVLAYAELTAFERLADDATMAPTLGDKAALGTLAVTEF